MSRSSSSNGRPRNLRLSFFADFSDASRHSHKQPKASCAKPGKIVRRNDGTIVYLVDNSGI